ncbi:MAG: hypothetical protein FP815_09260 [Desulfobulbaceae bacterium]|nr:hypothetical protein [Desulfobulbaceae bacterium]
MKKHGTVLLLFVATFTFFGCSSAKPPETKKLKVLVVGIDGMEPSLVDDYLSQGKLLNLKKIINNGFKKTIPTNFALSSPVIWTSIATGVPPEIHGITDFTIDGKPVNSASRKVPAFWNILDSNMVKAATLAWWATWPAERDGGIMIGDRVYWQERPQKVYPEGIIDTTKFILDDYAGNFEFLPRFTSYPYDSEYKTHFSEGQEEYQLNKLIADRLIRIYCRDRIYIDIAKELSAKKNLEVLSIYLQGIDHVQHAFWQYMDPEPFRKEGITVSGDNVARLGRIIPEYYAFIDELVGTLLTLCDEKTLIFVLSDHGFGPDPSVIKDTPKLGLSGNHKDETVFIMSGRDVRREADATDNLEMPTQLDFLPTLLYALRLPVAKDISGRPLDGYFTNEFRTNNSVSYISTYKTNFKKQQLKSSLGDDGKVIEDLRGLGYVK